MFVGIGNAGGAIRFSVGIPDPIAESEDLSVVIDVMRMVDRMVLAPHDGINVQVHGIMDVCSPHGSEKEKDKMCQVVTGNNRKTENIRTCLQYSVKGMERNAAPRSKGLWAVVLVVEHMNVLVKKFVCVKSAMHPVDSNLH